VTTTRRRLTIIAAAAAIVAYGSLLRLDAYVGKYGVLDRPAWARVMTHDVAAFARAVRPGTVIWQRIATPYAGGDPISYLKFGREMTSFYQPHVREPVFLAAIRVSLWLLQGQDAAVSLASAVGSVLMIVAAFLLGRELAGIWAGLAAALVMAIEYDLIIWSVDGWRDDMFSAFALLSAWTLLRLYRRASFGNAVLAGLVCGLTCLTRVTALSFIVPALLWIAAAGRARPSRQRLTYTALAAGLSLAVLAPFLISCAIATGDPFLAIDQQTVYYRAAEGARTEQSVSAGRYLADKFAARPIATMDVGLTGLFVRPFAIKWNGFRVWLSWLGTALFWCSLAGLATAVFLPEGRFLLLILFASLLPYAFTWNIGGGGEWRFTMHAYGFYVVAAMYAIALAARRMDRRMVLAVAWRAAIVVVVAAAATAIYVVFPWFVVREGIALGDSVSVEAGPRDVVFFRSGWSPATAQGNIMVRVSREPRAVVHFPLPSKSEYDVVLRFDPVAPGANPWAMILFNQQLAGRIALSTTPGRVGSYRLTLPRDWQKAGDNELAIASSGAEGARLWLVRILPMRPQAQSQ